MNNYSELTDTPLKVEIRLLLIGNPDYRVTVDGVEHTTTTVTQLVDNTNPFAITVELRSKDYAGPETAVVVDSITVDGIAVIPRYEYLAQYTNDHSYADPTTYIGFVGKWTLTFDPNFYLWLHGATGQGWLLKP